MPQSLVSNKQCLPQSFLFNIPKRVTIDVKKKERVTIKRVVTTCKHISLLPEQNRKPNIIYIQIHQHEITLVFELTEGPIIDNGNVCSKIITPPRFIYNTFFQIGIRRAYIFESVSNVILPEPCEQKSTSQKREGAKAIRINFLPLKKTNGEN